MNVKQIIADIETKLDICYDTKINIITRIRLGSKHPEDAILLKEVQTNIDDFLNMLVYFNKQLK